jgi:hypothetical protein
MTQIGCRDKLLYLGDGAAARGGSTIAPIEARIRARDPVPEGGRILQVLPLRQGVPMP